MNIYKCKKFLFVALVGSILISEQQQVSALSINGGQVPLTFEATTAVKPNAVTYHSNGKAATITKYHSNGNRKEYITYSTTGARQVANYYNTSGVITVKRVYFANGKTEIKYTYTNGKLTNKKTYYSTGVIKLSVNYGSNGKRTAANYYNSKGVRTQRRTYYTDGVMKQKQSYNSAGTVTRVEKYNTSGNVTVSTVKVSDKSKTLVGKGYATGGTGPNSFDCSGFVQHVYSTSTNVSMPRTTGQQSKLGTTVKVDRSSLREGDLLFYGSTSAPYHVAIYIGNGKFIHAGTPSTGVAYGNIDTFKPSFAKRIV